MLHFLFFMKQCTTNFSKLSSFKLMLLYECTFLNIDSSTSHEVTGAQTKCRNFGQSESIQNFILFPNILLLVSFLSTFWPFSLLINPYNKIAHILHFWHRSYEKTSVKGAVMQVNVIFALKPEKLQHMQYKSLNYMLLNLKILKIRIMHEFSPQKENMQTCTEKV